MTVTIKNCPICKGEIKSVHRHMIDDRYGYPGKFSIYQCVACQHMSLYPKLTEGEIGEIYSKFYPRKKFSGKSIRSSVDFELGPYSTFNRWIRGTNNQGQFDAHENELVLDIGVGSCESLIYLKERGIKASGVEADRNVAAIADYFNLEVYIEPLISFIKRGKKYDLIILNQVIEHFIDPMELVKNLSDLLNPGGRILISCPNAKSIFRIIFSRSWINWHVPYHQHHFSRFSLEMLFSKSKFKITSIKTVTPNLWLHLQIRNAYKYIFDDTLQLWNVELSGGVVSQVSLIRRIIRRTFDALLQVLITALCRLIDFLGMGDSLYVELRRE